MLHWNFYEHKKMSGDLKWSKSQVTYSDTDSVLICIKLKLSCFTHLWQHTFYFPHVENCPLKRPQYTKITKEEKKTDLFDLSDAVITETEINNLSRALQLKSVTHALTHARKWPNHLQTGETILSGIICLLTQHFFTNRKAERQMLTTKACYWSDARWTKRIGQTGKANLENKQRFSS